MLAFVLHPGQVVAKDHDVHHIPASELERLYNLCRWPKIKRIIHGSPGYINQTGHIHLYPDSTGRYEIPRRYLKLLPNVKREDQVAAMTEVLHRVRSAKRKTP